MRNPQEQWESLGKEDLLLVEEDQVRGEHFNRLDIHKNMAPDGMHPQMLRVLVNVIVDHSQIIFQRSWQLGEVPEEANITPVFKKGNQEDLGNCRMVNITSILGEMMEQIIMETKHIKGRKVIGSSQCGFTKGKSCLTNLITFYDEKAVLVDKGKPCFS